MPRDARTSGTQEAIAAAAAKAVELRAIAQVAFENYTDALIALAQARGEAPEYIASMRKTFARVDFDPSPIEVI